MLKLQKISNNLEPPVSVQVPKGMKISFKYSSSIPEDFIGIEIVPNKNKIWWKFWQKNFLYKYSYFEPIEKTKEIIYLSDEDLDKYIQEAREGKIELYNEKHQNDNYVTIVVGDDENFYSVGVCTKEQAQNIELIEL